MGVSVHVKAIGHVVIVRRRDFDGVETSYDDLHSMGLDEATGFGAELAEALEAVAKAERDRAAFERERLQEERGRLEVRLAELDRILGPVES